MQIGVESEYIVALRAFSNRTSVQTLIPFLKRIKSTIADAGYEICENYMYMEENGQESFIKPMNYKISKTRKYKANPYTVENIKYDEENDTHTLCQRNHFLLCIREDGKDVAGI